MSLEQEVELIRQFPIFSKIQPAMQKLLCFSSERLTRVAGVEHHLARVVGQPLARETQQLLHRRLDLAEDRELADQLDFLLKAHRFPLPLRRRRASSAEARRSISARQRRPLPRACRCPPPAPCRSARRARAAAAPRSRRGPCARRGCPPGPSPARPDRAPPPPGRAPA